MSNYQSEENASEYYTGNRGKNQRKKKKSKAAWIVIGIIAVILIVAIIVLLKWYDDIQNPERLFQPTTTLSPVQPTLAPSVTQSPQSMDELAMPTPTIDPEVALQAQADMEFMKNRVNILMLGIDESVERENWGTFRTDTMILVSVNFETQEVDMISIPRDSYVKIRDNNGELVNENSNSLEPLFAKVNSAFAKGGGSNKNGYAYAMKTIAGLLEVPVDYYMAFNMNVVKELVDAIGGVDYNVDIDVVMNGRTLSPGFQHLNGQQVLDYCRMRKGSSDIARVDRQQRMLMAIFQEMKTSEQLANLPSIYQAVEQNIETNLNLTQIASLALMALDMDLDQLERHTVPGEFLDMNKISYWGISMEKLQKMMYDIFGTTIMTDPDIDVTLIRERLTSIVETDIPELNAANWALKAAELLTSFYSAWFTEEATASLQLATDQVNEAILEGNASLMAANAVALRDVCLALSGQIETYGETMPLEYTTAISNVDLQLMQAQGMQMLPAA